MVRKRFVQIELKPPYFSEECAKVGGRKLWVQLKTGRGQSRTIGGLAKIIQENFKLTHDINLVDQNGYTLEHELDSSVVDDVKFGHSCIFVWPALKHLDPTVITEALSALPPLPLDNDLGTRASAEQTKTKRKYQTIHHGSSNDGDLDSGMSDGGDVEVDKFNNQSSKIALAVVTANEDDTGNQPDNKKSKLDLAKAAIAPPLMEDLTQQDSGLVTQQEFVAAQNWKIPELPVLRTKLTANRNRPIKKLVVLISPLSSSSTVPEKASEIRETSTVSFGSSVEDLIPDSIKSGTKRRRDTPYPKDVDPWIVAKRRRLTLGEELHSLDEDSEMEIVEEKGTPKVQENVIALVQEDDAVYLVPERPNETRETTSVSFDSSLKDLMPDSIRSGTKRRKVTLYPEDVDPWNDVMKRVLELLEKLRNPDKASEIKNVVENGTPKVQENVVALVQEDATVCLASIGKKVEETAVMNLDAEKYTVKLNKGENSMKVEDQEDEEESEVRVTRKKQVDERHENLWTVSFSFSELNDSLFPDSIELEKNHSF